MNKAILIVVPLLLLLIGGYFFLNKSTTTTYPTLTPKQSVVPSPEAVMKKIDEAELKAVGGYTGSGRATRSFENGKFTHTVEANLSDPAKGKFYEGWLVDKEPTLRFFSTGKLSKEGGVYKLTFTANQNYPEYNDVVVTLETESLGLDGKPEAHVLEGSF